MQPTDYQTGYSGLTGNDIANYLKRSFTKDDTALVESLITMFEATICSLCNRQFKPDVEITERFDLPGQEFYPSSFPIKDVNEISINSTVKDYDEDDDYFVYPTRIEFYQLQSSASRSRRALEIKYTIDQFWGEEVKLLLTRLVAHMWLNSENGVSVTEAGFSGVREVFALDKFKKETDAIINLYRKRHI